MVGHETLDLVVEVRILPRQPSLLAEGFEANERRPRRGRAENL